MFRANDNFCSTGFRGKWCLNNRLSPSHYSECSLKIFSLGILKFRSVPRSGSAELQFGVPWAQTWGYFTCFSQRALKKRKAFVGQLFIPTPSCSFRAHLGILSKNYFCCSLYLVVQAGGCCHSTMLFLCAVQNLRTHCSPCELWYVNHH